MSAARGLRRATGADLAGIEALVRAAYGHYEARIGRPPGPMVDDYAARIAAGEARVIGPPDALEALLVLVPHKDHLLLDNVAVAPHAQGRGLGRALIAAAEAEARALGLPKVRLYTHETMVENIALYTRLGYAETGRRTERGLRRVYMAKGLGGAG